MDLRPGERLDDLGRSGLRIIQHPGRFPFAIDAVLLAHFVRVRRSDRIIDFGTGTGIIPLLLGALHPTVRVTGVEIQPESAEMAARSVALNELSHRISVDCGDHRDAPVRYGQGSFDVVTMNPPYREAFRGKVSPLVARAAARHETTGTLAEALQAASKVLRHRGILSVVFLAERLVDLAYQLRTYRLEPKRLRLIHSRLDKPANLVLVEAVKGGRSGLATLPPLAVYEAPGVYSPEMREIYGGLLNDGESP